MKLIKNSTWLKLAIDLRTAIIRTIWQRVIATIIFSFLIAIAYQQGFPVNQPILAIIIPQIILIFLLILRTNNLRYLLIFYCLSLPFQMVETLQWWTIPVVGVVAFVFFGIEALLLEIENPFRCNTDDIYLDKLCQELHDDVKALINSETQDSESNK